MLSHRFDEQVSEADILNWLYNFDEADWGDAITLLNQVTFYSEHRMSDVLENGLRMINAKMPQNEILIVPIGGIGKSGGVMAYMVNKLMGRMRKNGWQFKNENTKIGTTPYKVVLLDDFVGTGNSALTEFQDIKGLMPKGCKYFCLCVAFLKRAKQRLEREGIEVLGDCHYPAFSYRYSLFGYPVRMKPIKEFATKYGELLYAKKPYKQGMSLYVGPLGYGNCQALIAFDHTTPNNSLPILWESKRRSDNHEHWRPIFPRRLYDETIRQDSFERRKYLWMSIAMKLTAGQVNRPFNSYNRKSTLLLGLLFCKIQRRSEAYTCVMLEITQTELSNLCLEADKWGILDANGNVTEEGRLLYRQIRKEESKSLDLVTEGVKTKEWLYIPKEFLGVSRDKTISVKSRNWFLRFLQTLVCECKFK